MRARPIIGCTVPQPRLCALRRAMGKEEIVHAMLHGSKALAMPKGKSQMLRGAAESERGLRGCHRKVVRNSMIMNRINGYGNVIYSNPAGLWPTACELSGFLIYIH